jgi:hypothetical protein
MRGKMAPGKKMAAGLWPERSASFCAPQIRAWIPFEQAQPAICASWAARKKSQLLFWPAASRQLPVASLWPAANCQSPTANARFARRRA